MSVLFVTGTGTEVGKTWFATRLITAMRERGTTVAARKPAQSFEPGSGPTDADLLAAVSGTVAPHWTVDAGWQYTTDLSQTQRFNSSVRYQPEPGQVVNVAYRYTNGALATTSQPVTGLATAIPSLNTLRQVDLSTQWPLTSHLSAVARYNYSIQDSKALETLMGMEYNAGCWAFRIVAHKFTTAAATQVTSVFMQLELNGLSKIGSNPLDILRRNIGEPSQPDAIQHSLEIDTRAIERGEETRVLHHGQLSLGAVVMADPAGEPSALLAVGDDIARARVDPDFARRLPHQPGEYAQHGGLARAAVADPTPLAMRFDRQASRSAMPMC